jgi:DNA repair photolyase
LKKVAKDEAGKAPVKAQPEMKTVSPVIISASRRNDTPACHSEWFMEGLKRGYLGVTTGGSRYVLFDKARMIVFWTKNPEPMFKYLGEIDQKEIGYYFQYTLNDYEAEGLEPNLPPLEDRITTFKSLSKMIGPEKVIWRFDPLVLTDVITKERLVEKIENLMKQFAGYTEKLVISFFRSDVYPHALKRMQENKINQRDFETNDIAFVAKQLGALGKKYNMKVATCAVKEDLKFFDIEHNKCIDDELIKRVFKDDKVLMSFLDIKENLKDSGQRPGCKCIDSEDIGLNNTCANGCLYCYANKSDEAVKRNLERIENGEISEFLMPPKKSEKSVKKNVDRISQKGEKRRPDLPN